MATHIQCPRCDGTGRIRTMVTSVGGKRHGAESDCLVCRGTGQASMLDKMGPPARRGAPSAGD